MTNLVLPKKSEKKQLSAAQRTFNRLKNKIDSLQEDIDHLATVYDEAILFYSSEFYPEQKKLKCAFEHSIKVLHKLHENLKLSKKKKSQLKELIILKAEELFDFAPTRDIDPVIADIMDELEGFEEQEAEDVDPDYLRNTFQDIIDEGQLDIDLSEIDFTSDDDTVFSAFQERLLEEQAKARLECEELAAKNKTKHQLEKERKAQELENLQKKGISSVYKQLAKAIHPDLEQDPALKAEKEVLMKKLTSAYENDDLHTILSLELEWMDRSQEKNPGARVSSDEQLKVYNSILKDQVKTLEQTLSTLHLSPKYDPIEPFCGHPYFSPKVLLKQALDDLRLEIEQQEKITKALSDERAEATIKAILDSYSSLMF